MVRSFAATGPIPRWGAIPTSDQPWWHYHSLMAYHTDVTDLVDKEVLTWQMFGDATQELASRVVASGFLPEIVVAIPRGGMIPAGALTYALGVNLTDTINVEFYTDVHETLSDPVLLSPMLDTEFIVGRRVLVVDDVVDTGRTLALVMKLLRGFGADVRSAVIYEKPATVFTPEYVWGRTDKWIVFPWSALPPVTARGSE